MKKSEEKKKHEDLKLETFKIMELSRPEKIQGGGDGGWTIRKDRDM
ncbi:hypothetical protein [Flagellimonas pacifica]|uniref:Uncharacterized protein n=1 Tax=Flagellimonas pacifica TaxID=1247520 RepID=A0A285MQR2_9FLAO|nr:hypothetical protein [Allomuricauda parva]SNY99522.1 hypothetical protein SAMN06265377_1332 [Allomuricauda parva]